MSPISRKLLDEIRQHAVEEYPHECCGLVLGVAGGAESDRLFRIANIQNKLHEEDPAAFPRDARTAYYMDPGQLMKAFREARERKLVVKTFYHSHPDHDAYFSDEDRKLALFDNEPVYPEAVYLVVSVYDRKVRREAVFSWNPLAREYTEEKAAAC